MVFTPLVFDLYDAYAALLAMRILPWYNSAAVLCDESLGCVAVLRGKNNAKRWRYVSDPASGLPGTGIL